MKLLSGARQHGKRDALVGMIASELLQGKTGICVTPDPAGMTAAIEKRLRSWGDTEPETAMCGLTVKEPEQS